MIFFSEGPQGTINKRVRFRLITRYPAKIFNVGFGDWDERNNWLDDQVETNNADTLKVLMTVARTIIDFSRRHRDALFFIEGGSLSRTRMYLIKAKKKN